MTIISFALVLAVFTTFSLTIVANREEKYALVIVLSAVNLACTVAVLVIMTGLAWWLVALIWITLRLGMFGVVVLWAIAAKKTL